MLKVSIIQIEEDIFWNFMYNDIDLGNIPVDEINNWGITIACMPLAHNDGYFSYIIIPKSPIDSIFDLSAVGIGNVGIFEYLFKSDDSGGKLNRQLLAVTYDKNYTSFWERTDYPFKRSR